MSLPKISEVARLYAEPTLKFVPSGKAVVEVPLVFNKRKKNQAGEWEDAGSMFVRGKAWEQFAENIAESLQKGDEVLVEGELSVREFERNDGSKGQSIELAVYAIGPNLKKSTATPKRIDRSPAADNWGSEPVTEKAPF